MLTVKNDHSQGNETIIEIYIYIADRRTLSFRVLMFISLKSNQKAKRRGFMHVRARSCFHTYKIHWFTKLLSRSLPSAGQPMCLPRYVLALQEVDREPQSLSFMLERKGQISFFFLPKMLRKKLQMAFREQVKVENKMVLTGSSGVLLFIRVH